MLLLDVGLALWWSLIGLMGMTVTGLIAINLHHFLLSEAK